MGKIKSSAVSFVSLQLCPLGLKPCKPMTKHGVVPFLGCPKAKKNIYIYYPNWYSASV